MQKVGICILLVIIAVLLVTVAGLKTRLREVKEDSRNKQLYIWKLEKELYGWGSEYDNTGTYQYEKELVQREEIKWSTLIQT
jgi:hypothetical protein